MRCNSCNAEWTTQSMTVIEKCPFCGNNLIQAIKPTGEGASREALLEYLEAAIDGENAVYACEKVISTLEQQKSCVKCAIAPCEPERDQFNCYFSDNTWKRRNSGDTVGCFVLLLVGILGALIGFKLGGFVMLIVGALAAGFLTAGIMDMLEIVAKNSAKRKRTMQGDARYREAMARYREQMDIYNQAVLLENATIAELDKNIRDMNARKERVAKVLKQIYARNMIHPNFHKMVAVTQIHDYLDMRICEQLEGPTGAYAEYMKDVRTDRICESIAQLEDTMKKGFSQMYAAQASILRAIRETNTSISEMSTSLSSSLNNMQQNLLSAQRASDAQMHTHMTQANQYLSNINRTLNNAAYNEYIALKETNASAYLRRIA